MAAKEKFIIAGDCAVRISDTQKGDHTVVLLHGYLESLDVWDEFGALLEKELRVVALDLPGHGISEVKGDVHSMEFLADTVSGAMDTLEVGKAILVGHSMGGYVALEVLRKYPDKVAGIVMFHSTPNPDSDKKKEDRQREINLVRSGKKELLSKTFPGRGFAERNRARLADVIEDLSEQIVLTEDEGIVAILRGIADRDDLNQMLSDSSVPQLFIFGRDDEYITPEVAAKVIDSHSQAKVVWLENSGHMGFVEEPEKSARAILDFCAEAVK